MVSLETLVKFEVGPQTYIFGIGVFEDLSPNFSSFRLNDKFGDTTLNIPRKIK